MFKLKLFAATLVPLLVSAPVSAEILELLNGRTANLADDSQLTGDAGIVLADDYRYLGGRVNYKISPDAVVYGDIGQVDLEDFADGITFGAGVFYQIQGLMQNVDTAVKASFHTGELEDDRGGEGDYSGYTFQFILSGKDPLGETNFNWYAHIGMHQSEVEGYDDNTDLGFGGGVVSATSFGEFFLGLNHIDEIGFGGGARFNF